MDGPGWQVMRPSRQRFYGHPTLIAFIESLGQSMIAQGWQGILVGDMAQARGGPMRTGHRSHQTGLDVDIWFLAAPGGRLSTEDRETMSAISLVAEGGADVRPDVWNPRHAALLRYAASFPEVDRIFVNPAIKRELCRTVADDRSWLGKIRPWWGHDAHLHVRLACPAGDTSCAAQAALPSGDGCDAGLDWWFSAEAGQKLRDRAEEPPARALTLDNLPVGCRVVFFHAEQM
jgi:penicillin-insensitive murein endopeptidase